MAPLNTVLIFRHCLRSTPFTVYGDPAYTNIDNYTARTFPEWSVPEYECLPRGLELLQAAGEQIFPSLPTPVKFRIDSSAKRDNDTAIALMEGMGLDTSVGVFEPCLFDPSDEGCYCDPQDTAEKTEAISKRLEEYAPPSDYENLLDKMQFTLGTGVAPSIADIANFVSGGYFTGGSSVASDVAEIFLMQMGGGIDFAWGEIDRGEGGLAAEGVMMMMNFVGPNTHNTTISRFFLHQRLSTTIYKRTYITEGCRIELLK